MEKLRPTLELHLQDEQEDSQFYRYGVGDYRVWFSQKNDSGNIYSVSIAPQKGVSSAFELYAIDRTMDRFYPDEFTISGHCPHMEADAAYQYIADMQKALESLAAIKELFLTGVHYELYCQRKVEAAFEKVVLGDYDLDGVELTPDDIATVTARVVGGADVPTALHEYLLSIREVLDIGLEEIDEEVL